MSSVEPLLSVLGPSVRSLYGSPEFQHLLSRCIQQNHLGMYCKLLFELPSGDNSENIFMPPPMVHGHILFTLSVYVQSSK